MEDYNQIIQQVHTDEKTKFRLMEKLEEIESLAVGQKATMVPILLKYKIVLEEAIQLSLETCQDAYKQLEELENKNELLTLENVEYKKALDPGKLEELNKLCETKNIEIDSHEKRSSRRAYKALKKQYQLSRGITQKYLK